MAEDEDRPEYIHCILHTHLDLKNTTWCGRQKEGFSFVDIDHAATHRLNRGRLLPCKKCVEVVVEHLRNED